MMRRWIALAILLWFCCSAQAIEPREFEQADQRARYETLLQELRCLVCQNETLAESRADLAADLRDEVYRMVKAGKDSEAIKTFLVARYGDFVLYEPPFKPLTYVLWLAPLAALLAGIGGVLLWVSRRRPVSTELTAAERERLRRLWTDGEDR